MSFGFSIGDFFATLHLLKRAAEEIRNYRNAPTHFQRLLVELELLQNTIRQAIAAEPTNHGEKALIERIRAIALHCNGPLQMFLDKMRSKEGSLGHFRKRTFSDVGIRINWSVLTRNDIDDLRKVILSEMVAINMLLSVQQM
jgi:hypothetical protein